MEIITTKLVVTNRVDLALARRGIITPKQVRSITILDVLVNIGSTTLCLPEDTIASLGLEFLKEVYVETASGIAKLRVFQDAKISLLSREGTFECVELPSGSYPLLGVIPLEALGIKLDLNNQKLEPLPISPTETYLTIL